MPAAFDGRAQRRTHAISTRLRTGTCCVEVARPFRDSRAVKNLFGFGWLALALVACSQGVDPRDAATDVAAADVAVSDANGADGNIISDDGGVDSSATDVPIAMDTTPTTDVVPTTDVQTVDDVMASDGSPVTDASDAGDGGVCTFGGIYQTMFAGMTAYFRFSADGLWSGATTPTGFDAPGAPGGTWSVSGTRFTIHDTGTTGCTSDQEGLYDITFGANCAATLTLVSDACDGRGMALGGITFTPYP